MLLVGGNANNGGNDGPGYVNLNNGLGNSNANIGVRPTIRYGGSCRHENLYVLQSAHRTPGGLNPAPKDVGTSLEDVGHNLSSSLRKA